MKATLSSSNGK